MAAPSQAQKTSSSFYAWAVVLMLFPVALLNYLDRMMVATMRSSIRADIPSIANDQEFGQLMALFMWVYALLCPVGGYLADRFDRRRMVIFSLFVWSFMTWMTGHVHTYGEMAWTRALMGISEAFYIPAALALIAELHPGNTRSRAVGIHTSGIYAGQALGGLGGYIADTSSWRNAFFWFGAVGILYSVVLILFLKKSTTEPIQAKLVSHRFRTTLKALFGTGAFIILALYFTLPAMPGWAVKNWLPTFLSSTFDMKQGPAGMSATGYVTIASFFGALLGGVLADHAMRYTVKGRIYTSALGVGLCVPALIGLGHLNSLNMAILWMILFGLGFGCFDANNMPILCQIVRHEHRATGYGFMNMISISMGAVVTIGLGSMRDQGIPLGVAFALSAIIALIAAGMILFVKPRSDLTQ